MPKYAFDADTAIQAAGESRWETHIGDTWSIGGKPNGGYLMSAVARAMAETVGDSHPDPVTVTAHFLRPGIENEAAVIDVETVRSGRTLSTLRGSLAQQAKTRIEVLAGFGDLESGSERLPLEIEPVEVAAPEDCATRHAVNQGVTVSLSERVELRLDIDGEAPPQLGASRAEQRGWVRFVDGREPDPMALVLFADVFPPPLFMIAERVGWVPTVEMTVHVRRRPAPGWIRAQFCVEDCANGRMIEDGILWDSRGLVVARSRQVGLVLDPAE